MPLNRFGNKIITEADTALALKHSEAQYLVCDYLNDGTNDELAGADYSSSSNEGKYTATDPTVITAMVITAVDSDVAQDTVVGSAVADHIDPEGFLIANTALTNGFEFGVYDSGASNLLDISVAAPIKSLYQLQALCSYHTTEVAVESATTTANIIAFTGVVRFSDLFGKGILLRKGDYLSCLVQDSLAALSLTVQVFGYKI